MWCLSECVCVCMRVCAVQCAFEWICFDYSKCKRVSMQTTHVCGVVVWWLVCGVVCGVVAWLLVCGMVCVVCGMVVVVVCVCGSESSTEGTRIPGVSWLASASIVTNTAAMPWLASGSIVTNTAARGNAGSFTRLFNPVP